MIRKIFFFFGLMVFCLACSYFDNKEKKAVEICQKAKVQFHIDNIWVQIGLSMYGLHADAAWIDFANMLAKQDINSKQNSKQNWTAKKTKEYDIYLVSFADENGWGHTWVTTNPLITDTKTKMLA